MKTILINSSVVFPESMLADGAVMIDEQGKIAFVGRTVDLPAGEGQIIDLEGKIIAPGLIDSHVHGGFGVTFGETGSLVEDLQAYSAWVARTGVTGFLTTISAPSPKEIVSVIKAMVTTFEAGLPGAQALGIHLEGPFLNVEMKGAQNPGWIRNPNLGEAKQYLEAGQGWIKQVTLAPELPQAEQIAGCFYEAGVCVALGHSTADYVTAKKALEGYWTHVTHTFNAQTGFHHRQPGVVGAVLSSERITAELIADLVHVHPGAMKVLVRCLGVDRIVLVTDAMEAAGLPDGDYALLGLKVTVVNGKATQEDGTIAGSSVTLNRCVKHMRDEVGVTLPEAIKMATLNPARLIGEAERYGSIRAGQPANLFITDHDLNIYATLVNGELVYGQL